MRGGWIHACIRRCKGSPDGLINPGSHLWWKENSESRRDWYRKESEVLEEYLVAITRRAEYLRSMDTWHQG